jgi:hypothetical protein
MFFYLNCTLFAKTILCAFSCLNNEIKGEILGQTLIRVFGLGT